MPPVRIIGQIEPGSYSRYSAEFGPEPVGVCRGPAPISDLRLVAAVPIVR